MRFFSFMRKKKVLILWYPVDENLGDYYLFNTVRKYAVTWGFDVQDMDVGAPYEGIAEAARKCDWLWFAGGGIIERGIPDIISNFPDFLIKSNHIKYGITGLSIGEFDYSSKSKEISNWVRNSSFFYTRDDYSADVLNSISKSDIVIPSADVVFAYDGLKKDYVNYKNEVGISFRPMPYTDLTGEIDWKLWNDSIQKNIAEKLIGIPDQFDVSRNFDFIYEWDYSPQNAVKVIEQIKFGIAMRYHVILIAARMGKVCIPIDYCPKVARLANQLGISELILHYNQADKLPQVVKHYLDNENSIKDTMSKKVEALEKRAQMMFDSIEHIMKEKMK